MGNTEGIRIPSQEQRDDVVEYGPEVPLGVRLERELELMHQA